MTLRIGLYCLLGGLCFAVNALGAGHFWWWWLCGVITVASLVPVVRWGPRHPLALYGAIVLALVVVGLVCTLSEAVLFFPQLKAQFRISLVGGTVVHLVAGAVLVALAKVLKLMEPQAQAVEHRPLRVAIPLVLVAGVSYVLYYQIFGVIIYHFLTRQYLPHAIEQAAALGLWFWVYEWARGLLMTLAVLPIIYSLRLPRWQAAVAVGALVWIVGGAAALLVPSNLIVAAQRYSHILEVLTQNASFGITALFLLRPKATMVPPSLPSATVA